MNGAEAVNLSKIPKPRQVAEEAALPLMIGSRDRGPMTSAAEPKYSDPLAPFLQETQGPTIANDEAAARRARRVHGRRQDDGGPGPGRTPLVVLPRPGRLDLHAEREERGRDLPREGRGLLP